MSEYLNTPQSTPPSIPVGQPIPQKKKFGCFKILLLGFFAFVALSFIASFFRDDSPSANGKPVDPAVTLSMAEANIISHYDGTAYSNSEPGLILAESFCSEFKQLAIEGTSTLKERHEFVTHCQLNEDSAAFLVHVPKLRKFEKESKERFCKIAWQLAQVTLTNSDLPSGSKIAVAVKGNILYQNIYVGTYSPMNALEEGAGITSKSKDNETLEEFFKPVTEAAEPPSTSETSES